MDNSTKEYIRLSKRMSELGICSRREADVFIEKGLVSVNGETISKLGSRVTRSDNIEVLNEAKSALQDQVTIALNKPRDFVSSQPEKNYTHALTLIKKLNFSGTGFKNFNQSGLAPLGRLDIDSTGLIVYSQKGSLAKKIIGADTTIEKEYEVNITEGELTTKKVELLREGLSLDDERLKPATVKVISPTFFTITLKQGKKRQIRRMCELVDLKVTRLKRIRIGKLKLNDLEEGKWRFIKDSEIV